jgi:hypothetical protein
LFVDDFEHGGIVSLQGRAQVRKLVASVVGYGVALKVWTKRVVVHPGCNRCMTTFIGRVAISVPTKPLLHASRPTHAAAVWPVPAKTWTINVELLPPLVLGVERPSIPDEQFTNGEQNKHTLAVRMRRGREGVKATQQRTREKHHECVLL